MRKTATVMLLAALVATCLAHGAESTAARRSLRLDEVFPAVPRSGSGRGKCWESMLTLAMCKHDLLASFTGCPVPRACCRAACDVDDHCGVFTRAFVGSLLPHSMRRQCAAATGRPNARAPPARAPGVAVASPRVPSSGARPPPAQDAYTSVRSPPPRAPRFYFGPPKVFHRSPPPPMFETSVQFAPPDDPSVSGGTPPPEAYTSVRLPPPNTPRVSSGATLMPPTAVPLYGGAAGAGAGSEAPKPKVITTGGPPPVAVAAAAPRISRTGSPSLPYGTRSN